MVSTAAAAAAAVVEDNGNDDDGSSVDCEVFGLLVDAFGSKTRIALACGFKTNTRIENSGVCAATQRFACIRFLALVLNANNCN